MSSAEVSREKLKEVAQFQKGILFCILLSICVYGISFAVPQEMKLIMAGILGLTSLVNVAFAMLLGVKVYSPVTGVILGVLTVVPCLGLIILLVINQAATKLLTAHGVKVGLMGARMSDLK